MAFAPPTANDLIDRYPAFADVPERVIRNEIEDALLDVGESWVEAHRVPAILALAAHRLVVSGALASDETKEFTNGLGTVTEMRAGDTQIKFGKANESEVIEASAYARTPYGRRFVELRARSFPAIAII